MAKAHRRHVAKTTTHDTPAPDSWPEPAVAPGDDARVERIVTDVRLITDVGSLTRVLAAVMRHATQQRVRPDVIRGMLTAHLGDV